MRRIALNKTGQKSVLLLFYFIILAVYIVYEQAVNCLSIDLSEQLLRHERMLAGNSEFFNPWQYRIFSTYIVEFFALILSDFSFPKIYPFLLIRFLQNILIFFVAYTYYRSLKLKSSFLILAGLSILAYNMSNSVFMSDLSINTYFDILFYLIAGLLILKDKINYSFLILVVIAAFNRETSGFIPFMLIVSSINFKTKKVENWKNFRIGVLAFILFLVVVISLRVYYGMPPSKGIHGISSPKEFFIFNISFLRMYPQLIGTLGIIPPLVILKFNHLSPKLKLFFILIVPIWFIIHFIKSQAMETRLFLVPQALIFIPGLLQIIEREIESKLTRRGLLE